MQDGECLQYSSSSLGGREPVVVFMSSLTLRSSHVLPKGYVTLGTVLSFSGTLIFHLKNECDNSSYVIALEVG